MLISLLRNVITLEEYRIIQLKNMAPIALPCLGRLRKYSLNFKLALMFFSLQRDLSACWNNFLN